MSASSLTHQYPPGFAKLNSFWLQNLLRLSQYCSQFESRKMLKVSYLNRTSPTLQHDFPEAGQGRPFLIAKFVPLLFQWVRVNRWIRFPLISIGYAESLDSCLTLIFIMWYWYYIQHCFYNQLYLFFSPLAPSWQSGGTGSDISAPFCFFP